MRTPLKWLAPCLCLALPGCRVGPDYSRPSALSHQREPPGFANQSAAPVNEPGWKQAQPLAHIPRGAWWTLFADPELDRLQELAQSANQNLAAAAARVEEARALSSSARAGLFPHLSAGTSATRQRTSFNSPIDGRAAGKSHTFSTFTIPFEAGWEPDLWGRVSRQTEAARANLASVEDDLQAARLSLQAEVAAHYFALRVADAEASLLARTVENWTRSTELVRNRRKGGIATDLDVSQAETQLRVAQAQLPDVALRRSRILHGLAVLCGQFAGSFTVNPFPSSSTTAAMVEQEKDNPPAVPWIPAELPSELLERRPDVAAAERRMAAANAAVGIAKTAFYPRIRLNGLAGLQSVDAATWMDWPSRFWAVGPSLDLPLFTGGRNRAQLAQARAEHSSTVARYRQTVLEAFADVEDQLASQTALQQQLDAERAALASARKTLEIAGNRYKAGLVTYLEVSIAQNSALARETAVVRLNGERSTAAVALIKSLGGGWSK